MKKVEMTELRTIEAGAYTIGTGLAGIIALFNIIEFKTEGNIKENNAKAIFLSFNPFKISVNLFKLLGFDSFTQGVIKGVSSFLKNPVDGIITYSFQNNPA